MTSFYHFYHKKASMDKANSNPIEFSNRLP